MSSTDLRGQESRDLAKGPGTASVGTDEPPGWGTSGAIAGIVFVVLLAAAVVTSGGAPLPDKSAAEMVKWYSSHRTEVSASAMIGALASVAFFWFLTHLRQVLAGRSATFDRLRDGLLTAGVATAILGGFNALPQVALAITVNRPDVPPNDSVVRMLADLNQLTLGPLTLFLSLTMAILAAILLMGGLARRWVGWLAVGSAVASLIGGCGAFFTNTEGRPLPLAFLGIMGLALFLLTVLTTSVMVLRAPQRVEAAAV